MLEHAIIILTKQAHRVAVLPFAYVPSAWDNVERMKAIASQYLADNGLTMADHAYLNGSLHVWIN
jgi:hypothetical protein